MKHPTKEEHKVWSNYDIHSMASVMKADIHYGLGMCPKATYRNVSVDATDEKQQLSTLI